jgi:hypothetical protein
MAPWGTGESQPADLTVSIATFGLGDDIVSWFGHSALIVEDSRLRQARLYNYGMFSFDNAMLRKFAMGRLEFWVGEDAVRPTFEAYKRDNRDVTIQVFNLLPSERAALAKALAINVLPQNRQYLYHHYFDNCSTRPRDLIDRAINGQLHQAEAVPARMTLRAHTERHASVLPPMSVLLDFLMNHEIDQPITRWDEAFLPAELEHQLATLTYVNADGQTVPLVARTIPYYVSSRRPIPETPPTYLPWLLALGLVTGSLGFGLARLGARRWARVAGGLYMALVGLVFGLPGTALLIMWLITNHTVTWHNENLLLANPLTLLAVPCSVMAAFGSARGRTWARRLWTGLALTGLLALAVKALPWFDQNNWRLIALILPVSLHFAAAYRVPPLASRKP